MTQDFKVAKIEIIPIRLPLTVPFVIAYASYREVQSVLVKITSASGAEGWGEATPDPHVTGESWHGVAENLRHSLAPVIVGTDARNIALAHARMNDLQRSIPRPKPPSISLCMISLDASMELRFGHCLEALVGIT